MWEFSWGVPSKGIITLCVKKLFKTAIYIPCSQAVDYLAIAVHELGNISERRTEILTNEGDQKVIRW